MHLAEDHKLSCGLQAAASSTLADSNMQLGHLGRCLCHLQASLQSPDQPMTPSSRPLHSGLKIMRCKHHGSNGSPPNFWQHSSLWHGFDRLTSPFMMLICHCVYFCYWHGPVETLTPRKHGGIAKASILMLASTQKNPMWPAVLLVQPDSDTTISCFQFHGQPCSLQCYDGKR